VPLGQRCGKFSKSARQRTMPMRARSMASGDSDAISLSIISASVSISFVIECSLLRSRGASRARGLFQFALSACEERGRRASRRDQSVCARLRAKTWRLPARGCGVLLRLRAALCGGGRIRLPFRHFGRKSANVPAPVAMLLAGGSYWPPGGAHGSGQHRYIIL
jgi:hypothetical protein